MEFTIEIKETLSRLVDVEADSKEEAIRKVQEMYDNGDIVLTADDYASTDIEFFDI